MEAEMRVQDVIGTRLRAPAGEAELLNLLEERRSAPGDSSPLPSGVGSMSESACESDAPVGVA